MRELTHAEAPQRDLSHVGVV